VQQRLDGFSLIRQRHTLDRPAREPDELVVAGALFFSPGDPFGIVILVDRPHRVGVKDRRHVIVLARLHPVACLFGLAREILAALGGARELARDIGKFLHPAADLAHIAFHARTAVAQYLRSPALIPIQSPGLDHLIQEPSLLSPTSHFSFGLYSHKTSRFRYLLRPFRAIEPALPTRFNIASRGPDSRQKRHGWQRGMDGRGIG